MTAGSGYGECVWGCSDDAVLWRAPPSFFQSLFIVFLPLLSALSPFLIILLFVRPALCCSLPLLLSFSLLLYPSILSSSFFFPFTLLPFLHPAFCSSLTPLAFSSIIPSCLPHFPSSSPSYPFSLSVSLFLSLPLALWPWDVAGSLGAQIVLVGVAGRQLIFDG